MKAVSTAGLLLMSGFLLLASACGGDDNSSAAPSPSGAAGSSDAAPTAAVGDGGSGGSSGQSSELGSDTGTVTIGDETWEFDVSVLRLSAFGAYGAAGKAVDGSDIDVELDLPPNDWETRADRADWQAPSIRVGDDENDKDWVAGGDLVSSMQGVQPEMSQVTSFKIDGSKASGTAVFIDSYTVLRCETPEPVEGTFEFSCDEDPYS